MIHKFSAFVLFYFLSSSLLKAQDSSRVFTLAMRPFHALVGGYRVDAEHQIGESNQWIQVGGELYFNSISRYGDDDRRLRRGSLDYSGQGYGISVLTNTIWIQAGRLMDSISSQGLPLNLYDLNTKGILG